MQQQQLQQQQNLPQGAPPTYASPMHIPSAPASTPLGAPQGYQQPSATLSYSAPKQSNDDVLKSFDPFAKPTPIKVSQTDPISVAERLKSLTNKGLLYSREYEQIHPHVHLLPTKITMALDQLEQSNDRSGVFELVLNLQQQQPHSEPQFHQLSAPLAVPPGGAPGWGGGASAGVSTTSLDTSAPFSPGADWVSPGSAAKTMPGGVSDSDSGDGSDEEDGKTIVDSDDEKQLTEDEQLARKLQQQFDAEATTLMVPNPCAGGFKGEIPKSFTIMPNKFMGQVLYRVTSKKLFRKWKQLFFVINKEHIRLYDSILDFEARRSPRIVYRIHPRMYIRKPTVKQTFSIMDDGRRIYYTTFRENVVDEGSTGAYAIPTENRYNYNAKSQRICKFGATSLTEIQAFAYSVHSVIMWNRRQSATADSGAGGRYS